MRRRDFIAGVGGVALSPLVARAQQSSRIRRIGALMTGDEGDQAGQSFRTAFEQGLQKLGWTDGSNVGIDYRWPGVGDVNRYQTLAAELVGLRPDVFLAVGAPALEALGPLTRSTPIVFAIVNDPVALRFVANMGRPSGNITGFIAPPPSLGGKYLELLKEIARQVTRMAFLYNPQTGSYATSFLPYAQGAAAAHKVELIEAPVRNDSELENTLETLAGEPHGGLIVISDDYTTAHHGRIIAAASQRRLPAFFTLSGFVRDGGLISYGPDYLDQFRQAAGYVDRILRGEKPTNLPVQAPVRYEMVVNLITARAIGLTIPETFLVRADKVIE